MTEIPATAIETPVIPISDTPPNLPRVGMGMGAKTAAWMSPLYVILLIVGIFSVELVMNRKLSFTDLGSLPFMGMLVCVVGGVPAIIIGTIAGGIIGWILSLSRGQLPWTSAFAIGVGVGATILFPPNLWMGLAMGKVLSESRGVDWVQLVPIWYLPCLFALLGLGWVAYRLNDLKRE